MQTKSWVRSYTEPSNENLFRLFATSHIVINACSIAHCRLFTSTAVSAAKSTRSKIQTKPTWKILEPEQRNHLLLPICTPARQHQEQGAGVRTKVKRI